MSFYFYIDYIMILKTFDKTIEIDNIEDLTKLSNADRLKLFGFIYPNSMIKNYGKINNNKYPFEGGKNGMVLARPANYKNHNGTFVLSVKVKY